MASVSKDTASGAWVARWRDPGNQQRKKSFRRKVDATRYLAQLEADLARGTYVAPEAGRVTFASRAKAWEDGGLSHLKPSTATRYVCLLNKHVVSEWGEWQIAHIKRSDVTAWVARLQASGLSASTVRQTFRIMSLVLAAAVADDRIGRNPCSGVKLPPPAKHQPRIMTPEQVEKLANGAGRDRLHIIFLAFTGLRFGEFAALRVGSLDVERGRVTVSHSVTEVRGNLVRTTPKTGKVRQVAVPRRILDELCHSIRGRSAEEPLFPAPGGGVLRINNWRKRVFTPACEASGVVGFTPHDLRHTAASLAIRSGATVKVVQAMLGHASAAMTLDIYAGLFPDELDTVANALDSLVP